VVWTLPLVRDGTQRGEYPVGEPAGLVALGLECNSISANYELDSDYLLIVVLLLSQMSCA
jgi:hypothetical protein